MLFFKVILPGLAVNTYIVGDDISRECVVIDPPRIVTEILDLIKKYQLRITYILETHVHADFISGARELKAALDNKPQICCSGFGGSEWIPPYADCIINQEDFSQAIQIGSSDIDGSNPFYLKAIHTPGHTPEHISWALYPQKDLNIEPIILFTGDFLFVSEVGRPDLLGTESADTLARELYKSLFQKIKPFSDDIEIFPAHGAGSQCGKSIGSRPSSTLGQERKANPLYQFLPEEKWVERLLFNMPSPPPYFKKIKQINVQGPKLIPSPKPGLVPLDPLIMAPKLLKTDVNSEFYPLIIDLNSPETFSDSHIPGAINIPFSPSFAYWAGWMLPENDIVSKRLIILVCDQVEQVEKAVDSLLNIGFDNIEGYIEGGMKAWRENHFPTTRLHSISVQELQQKMSDTKLNENIYILDVRTEMEWNYGHIPEAHHLFLGQLPQKGLELPKDKSIMTICGSGYRSSIAASWLQKHGFTDVMNIRGGMTAWNQMLKKV